MADKKMASYRSIRDVPASVINQLRDIGMLACSSVVPPCDNEPMYEFCRPGGVRSLLCRKHNKAFCKKYNVQFNEEN